MAEGLEALFWVRFCGAGRGCFRSWLVADGTRLARSAGFCYRPI
jgi:hypothetical protein